MNGDRILRLSHAEARDLKDLVEAELDRRFVAIKDKLDHYWVVVVGYDGEQAWSELRELVQDLVKSNLASLDKSLAIVLAAPPVKAPVVEAPKEPEPELEPVEPPVEPAAEPAAEAEVPAAEAEKPEPEPGSKRSRT